MVLLSIFCTRQGFRNERLSQRDFAPIVACLKDSHNLSLISEVDASTNRVHYPKAWRAILRIALGALGGGSSDDCSDTEVFPMTTHAFVSADYRAWAWFGGSLDDSAPPAQVTKPTLEAGRVAVQWNGTSEIAY